MGTPVAMNRLHIMTQENYTYDVLETTGSPVLSSGWHACVSFKTNGGAEAEGALT